MLAAQPGIAGKLQALEQIVLHERDATINHIRHVKRLRQESEAMIRGELEALREALSPTHAPPAIPDIEERYAAPRFINGGVLQ
jgi:hypothetical protein